MIQPGDIGKFVREWIPEFILFNTRLRNWYDSNCYRIFDARDENQVRGISAVRDILILRREDAPGYSLKPVIVVEGSATSFQNHKRVTLYKISVYGIDFKCNENIEKLEISPGVKITTKSQDVLKSYLEEYYMKVDSVDAVSISTIKNAVARYIKE
jgi:hypothetical protein